MSRRRGASLIELMVVITIASMIMGIVGTLFNRMFQSERIAARAAMLELTTARLADQFRRDVHAAQSVRRTTSDTQSPQLELIDSPDGPRVVYSAGSEKVQRELVGAKRTEARETYRLPGCRVAFPEAISNLSGNESSESSRYIKLAIERPQSTVTGSAQASRALSSLTIEPELGRDRRLSTAVVLTSPPESSEESK